MILLYNTTGIIKIRAIWILYFSIGLIQASILIEDLTIHKSNFLYQFFLLIKIICCYFYSKWILFCFYFKWFITRSYSLWSLTHTWDMLLSLVVVEFKFFHCKHKIPKTYWFLFQDFILQTIKYSQLNLRFLTFIKIE